MVKWELGQSSNFCSEYSNRDVKADLWLTFGETKYLFNFTKKAYLNHINITTDKGCSKLSLMILFLFFFYNCFFQFICQIFITIEKDGSKGQTSGVCLSSIYSILYLSIFLYLSTEKHEENFIQSSTNKIYSRMICIDSHHMTLL